MFITAVCVIFLIISLYRKNNILTSKKKKKKQGRIKGEAAEGAHPLITQLHHSIVALPKKDFNHICSTLETKASKLKDRLSRKLEVKFNNLKRKYGIPLVSNLNSDDIIFNYSHRVLTETEKMVLARGLRFCLPPKQVDRYDAKRMFVC